jgi:hypothetical protein
MKNLFLFLCLIASMGYVTAQTELSDSSETSEEDDFVLVIPPINEQLKVGIKMGTGMGMMSGPELQNARPKYVITGGAYLHYRFSKHWSVQPEANITFKGSKFENGDNEYSSVTQYAIDLPVLLMYGLTKNNTVNLFAGMQYSYNLNRSVYLKNAPVPVSPTPSLRNDDWFVVAGSQFQTPFLGFQVGLKYGLCNLNTSPETWTLNPPNTGKEIHQMVLELNILF